MVLIEQYCGYPIEYNALKIEFQVWIDDKRSGTHVKILKAKTQRGIQAKIDRLESLGKRAKKKEIEKLIQKGEKYTVQKGTRVRVYRG
jgi:hypothetical protein